MDGIWSGLKSLIERVHRKSDFGARAERAAEKFLRRKKMVIVERNYASREGEIDLIAVDARTVVFVEVKARRSSEMGEAFEAVDQDKERKIAKTALGFLQRNDLLEEAYRFDVVSILWPENARKPRIVHYENAFQSPEKNVMFG